MCRYAATMTILVYALVVCPFAAAAPGGVNLSEMADWDIIIAQDALPVVIYAAEEFQSHFDQASGVRLPIVKKPASAMGGQRHVFIGSGAAMRAGKVGFATDEFGEEDFRIIVRNDNITIAGLSQARARGTLYGVIW